MGSKHAIARLAVLGALAGPLCIGAMQAQAPQPPASGPSFEVATIKPNNSNDGRVFAQVQPGRFTATNATLHMLIRQAYQVQDFQISGEPGWATSDHFDVVAKIDETTQATIGAGPPPTPGNPGPIQLMIRNLLADRFKLATHNESKEQPIYALVLARSDGRLGPGLKKTDVDCGAVMARGRPSGPPPQPGGPMPPCGFRIGFGNMNSTGTSLPSLANSLGMFVGRIVRDKTGLAGFYELNLTWTPDQMPQRPPGAPPDQPIRVNGADIDPNGPSIFTALQEQLGLKLDAQRGPVEMLVIDRAEKPVEN